MREESLALGADGWFRDFRTALERVIAGIVPHRHDGNHIVQAPPAERVELQPVSGTPQHGRTGSDEEAMG